MLKIIVHLGCVFCFKVKLLVFRYFEQNNPHTFIALAEIYLSNIVRVSDLPCKPPM